MNTKFDLTILRRIHRYGFWLFVIGGMPLSSFALNSDLEILPNELTLEGTDSQSSGTVETYTIPYEDYPDTINIDMYGGDGGRAKAQTDGGADQAADGGGGLRTLVTLKVHPTDADSLRPGGELHFVIGNRGEYNTGTQACASGGGGGTGLLYRSPESGSGWVLLAVSGGGGGGAASTQIVNTYTRDGYNASDTTSGVDGNDGGGGGNNGNKGGSYTYNSSVEGGGGGGYTSSGASNHDGEQASTSGSEGGDSSGSRGGHGGFGYGGGGGGGVYDFDSLEGAGASGGGGGGYSGGGSGGHRRQGGGGGSYVNTAYTTSYTQTTRGGGNNDGKATATFTLNTSNAMPEPTVTPIGEDPYILYDYESTFSDPGAEVTDTYGNSGSLTGGFDTVVPGRVGEYYVTYQAIDDYGNTGSGTRAVSIISANKPTFDIIGDVTRDEDSGSYSKSNYVTNVNTNDDGQSLEYFEVTNDNNSLFTTQPAIGIDRKLTFTLADDAYGSATITVIACDNPIDENNGFSDPVTFTLTVNPIDDAPSDVTLDNNSAAENQTAIGTVSATEPFGGSLTYAITDGEDAELFSIVESTGVLTFKAAPDYESPSDDNEGNNYKLEVTATGTDGSTVDSFTINVTNIDEAPETPAIDNTVVIEGTTEVGTVSTNDPEGDDITYAIKAGPDKDLFTIDSNTGALSFLTAPDYDTPTDSNSQGDYLVRVVARANGLDSNTLLITVTVEGLNDQPTGILLDGADTTTATITEDSVDDQLVAVLRGVDPDEDDTFTFTLTDDAEGRFHIINDTELAVADSSLIDYESDTSHDITIQLTDSGGLTFSKQVTIQITDIEESALEEFRSQYGLANDGSNDTEDWSENGLPNILYLAFGLGDPNESAVDTSRLPEVQVAADGSIVFTYLVLIESGDLGATPQGSSDLSEWTPFAELPPVDRPAPPSEENANTNYNRISFTLAKESEVTFYRVEITTDGRTTPPPGP
ncbi:MAG: hypothetical protein ACSHYA_07330 [Opitutaceae bacterium]